MHRLSIIACGLLVSIWIAQLAYAQAPVIDISGDLSNSGSLTSSGATGESASLDSRLARLERLLENQTLVDLTLRMESMQQEIQRMFGELEVITHDISTLKRRQRELYLDNDRRFKKLESSNGTVEAPSSSSSGSASDNRASSSSSSTFGSIASSENAGLSSSPLGGLGRSTGANENETTTTTEFSDKQIHKAAYQAAFNLLREGKYDLAKIQFGGFLAKFPDSEDANKAQYWLGEVNYVQRNFDGAITEFNKVLANYPESSKFADALLKIGLSQFELEKWALASNAFNKIIERYPNTPEARLANQRLQKIELQKQ